MKILELLGVHCTCVPYNKIGREQNVIQKLLSTSDSSVAPAVEKRQILLIQSLGLFGTSVAAFEIPLGNSK
jgi:hypothetical protein